MTWFLYSTVKFIPDPMKNETVNVGMLVIDDAGNTRSRFIDNFDYITQIHGIEDVDLLEMVLPGYGINKENKPDFLETLSKESEANHRIKVISPRSINSKSLDIALDRLYSQMISIPDKNNTNQSLVSTVENLLNSAKFPDEYVMKNHTVKGIKTNSKYDFVFKNSIITDVLQVISFDVIDKYRSLYKTKSFIYDARDLSQKYDKISCTAYMPKPIEPCTQYEEACSVLNDFDCCRFTDENTLQTHLQDIGKRYSAYDQK